MYLLKFILILILYLSLFRITENFKNGILLIENDTNNSNKKYITFKIPLSNQEEINKINQQCQSEKNDYKSKSKSKSKSSKKVTKLSKKESIIKSDNIQTRGSKNPVGINDKYSDPPASIYSPEANKLLKDTVNNLLNLSSC